MVDYLLVSEAAEYARRSDDEIRRALRSKALRGAQRSKRGTWLTTHEWLDDWILGGNARRAS